MKEPLPRKDNKTSLIIFGDNEESLIEVEEALSNHLFNIYKANILGGKNHHIISQFHEKIVFIYACETIESAKNICEKTHNNEELSSLFKRPNVDFLLCPVKETKFAYDACIQDYFQDYSTMHPIYDKWNLVLRFMHIIDTNSIIRSKSELEKKYNKLKINAKNLVQKIKNRPNQFQTISDNMQTAINDAGEIINQGIKDIPKSIEKGKVKEYIDIADANQVKIFFDKQANTIQGSSMTGLHDLNHEISEMQRSEADEYDLGINAGTKSNSILLVDDEPFMQSIIRPTLEKNGYYLNYLDKGSKLFEWEKHLECEPDIILLDIDMPEINGLQVLRRIKNEGLFSGIPIIMLTGYSDQRVIRKAIELGSSDYITKPVKSEILLSKLKKLIN